MSVILLTGCAGTPDKKSSRPPNIIFILADDMGYADAGCYGQELISTPNLDKMANEGIRFTQHYAGSTVCAPSRDVLMTGLHTGHSYIRGNYGWDTEGNVPIPATSVTVAEILKEKGYATGIFGKWGLGGPGSVGGPNSQGFDQSLCYLDQREAHEYYPLHLWKNKEKLLLKGNQDSARKEYSHHLFVSGALDFIKDNKDNPFFLYLPFTLPHGKYQVPDDSLYADRDWSQRDKNYASMISLLDSDIGRIGDLLKELGLDENTIVFFASDNGPVRGAGEYFNSNGPFRGFKTELYEGGIRAPLIVRWPGKIKPGTVTDRLAAFWDFLPTASALAGNEAPEHIDGISYLPALLGDEQVAQHEFLYWEYFEYNYNWDKEGDKKPRSYLDKQAVRMKEWKAVRNNLLNHPDAPFELYNLRDDTTETKNIADQHPEIIREIEAYLETARNETEYFNSNTLKK